MAEELRWQELYSLQEAVLISLQGMNDAQFSTAKLCGGTALSRCWLSHRISHDLDFFLAEGFRATELAVSLKRAGIEYQTKDIVDDLRKANQLHGYVMHDGKHLKVSFVEDAYFDLYPVVAAPFGNTTVRTERVEGLYHRKLRTVSGRASAGDSSEGGRQTARDLFDLYVLSQTVMPLQTFMESLPYPFPSAAFHNGLANMPWFELMEEMEEIACNPKWSHIKDMSFLQNALFEQIGAAIVLDEKEYPEAPALGKQYKSGRTKR